MPKHKVSKTFAKRFKITGRKKILHQHAGTSHLRSKEDSSTRRRKNTEVEISPQYYQKMKRLLGV